MLASHYQKKENLERGRTWIGEHTTYLAVYGENNSTVLVRFVPRRIPTRITTRLLGRISRNGPMCVALGVFLDYRVPKVGNC